MPKKIVNCKIQILKFSIPHHDDKIHQNLIYNKTCSWSHEKGVKILDLPHKTTELCKYRAARSRHVRRPDQNKAKNSPRSCLWTKLLPFSGSCNGCAISIFSQSRPKGWKTPQNMAQALNFRVRGKKQVQSAVSDGAARVNRLQRLESHWTDSALGGS